MPNYHIFRPVAGSAAAAAPDDLDKLQPELQQPKYANAPLHNAREARRQELRGIHGHNDPKKRCLQKQDGVNAPIKTIIGGEDHLLQRGALGTPSAYIDGQDIRKRQGEVRVWVNHGAITQELAGAKIVGKTPADVVRDIQALKRGERIEVLPKNMPFGEYKRHLESIASHVVIRGVVRQHYDFQGNQIPGSGREVPLYYACFPKLVKGTKDYETYVNSNGTIKDENVLKNRFKTIILNLMNAAALSGDAVDIVTPNAFLKGLSDSKPNNQQARAKALFAEAAAEAASEFTPPKDCQNKFQGLVLHDSGDDVMKNAIQKRQGELQVPVIVGNGDALSPNEAAQAQRLSLRVVGYA